MRTRHTFQDRNPIGRFVLLQPGALMAYLGAGLFMVVLGIVGWALYDSRQAARTQAEQAVGNLTVSLERDIGRTVDTLDLSLRSAAQGMRLLELSDLSPEVRQSVLFDGALGSDGFGRVIITNELGRLIYDSRGDTTQSGDLWDRQFFQDHKVKPDQGLIISRPMRSRSDGSWTLMLSRRISHPDGSFAGVVAGELHLSVFEQIFTRLELGRSGSVSLLDRQGWLVLRRPAEGLEPGENVAGNRVFQRVGQGRSDLFVDRASADNVERIYGFRQVGSLPLVLTIGLATQDVFADWNQKSVILGGAMVLLGLLGLALAWGLREELRRQHAVALARLDTLFRHSPDAMFVANVRSRDHLTYEEVNPVWERMTGIPDGAAIGRSPDVCWPPEVAEIVRAGWERCLSERVPARYSYVLQHDGQRREWEAFVAPVFDGFGRVHRLIGVARDMTEHNHMEGKLRQSHRLEAVGQLTAGIAHDFNNLLQAVLGSAETIAERQHLDQEDRECLILIRNAAQRGASLVHQLLTFSRKQTLAPVAVRPEKLLANVSALLTRTLGGKVDIQAQVEERCWPVVVDRNQFDNCVLNIAINARDAMPGGGLLRITVGNTSVSEGQHVAMQVGDYVRFRFADTGTGMSAETVARALEPFFTTKPIGQGTGLGLSTVLGFARQSGGDIEIESKEDVGTTINLWLPRAKSAIEVERLVSKSVQPASDRSRVLLVDDEAMVRRTLTTMLTRAGLQPLAVESGEQALNLLRDGTSFELLVTDQSMPVMSGCELIEQAVQLRPGLATMLITGYDKVEGLDRLEGRVTILRKPFERAVFVGQVQALLLNGEAVTTLSG